MAGEDRTSNSAHSYKALMDYTLFHIGLYTTLMTAMIAISRFSYDANGNSDFIPEDYRYFAMFSLLCFLVAGAAGGMVASHIPEQTCEFKKFWNTEKIGLWDCKMFVTKKVAYFEHLVFWIGVATFIIGVFVNEFLW